MWLSFALIILVATLFLIFAEELVNVIKNLWKKWWFKQYAPLFIASCLFFQFEVFLTLIFNQVKVFLFNAMSLLDSFLPQSIWSTMIVRIFVLLIFTMAPIIIIDSWLFYKYKTKRLKSSFFIALMTWIFLAVLYVSGIQFD